MRILFKYATRSRPENFKRGLLSILNKMNQTNWRDYLVLVTTDDDDWAQSAVREICGLAPFKINIHGSAPILVHGGSSKSKVDAINRVDWVTIRLDHSDLNWDILVNMSDDMVFDVQGFDDIIRQNIDFPQEKETLLHFPDGVTPIVTMSIMSRAFYRRFGYIYNPEYKSLFCDNEQTEVAKIIGAYKFVDQRIFTHMHPSVGLAKMDDQYQHTESFWNHDKAVYDARKQRNFDL